MIGHYEIKPTKRWQTIFGGLMKDTILNKLRPLFFVTLLVSAMSSLQAQHKSYIGLKAGGHLSDVLFQHEFQRISVRNTYDYGLHMGLMYKYYNKQNVGLILGVDYVQKGWTQNFFELYPNYTARLNYLELPALATAYLGNGRTKYFMAGGIYAEYLINFNLDEAPEASEPFDWFTYDPNRDDRFGYGVRIGGGITHDFTFGQIHLEGFLTYSLSHVLDPISRASQTPDNSNNFVVGASVAYLLSFGDLDLF